MELSGLPPLCPRLLSISCKALFKSVVILTDWHRPIRLCLDLPATALSGVILTSSPASLIRLISPFFLSHFSLAGPISPFSNGFLFSIKQTEQTMVTFPDRTSRKRLDQTTKWHFRLPVILITYSRLMWNGTSGVPTLPALPYNLHISINSIMLLVKNMWTDSINSQEWLKNSIKSISKLNVLLNFFLKTFDFAHLFSIFWINWIDSIMLVAQSQSTQSPTLWKRIDSMTNQLAWKTNWINSINFAEKWIDSNQPIRVELIGMQGRFRPVISQE